MHTHVWKKNIVPGRLACNAFNVQCFYQSWDYVCPVCVRRERGGMWRGEDATSWCSDAAGDGLAFPVLSRKNTIHLPPSSFTAPLMQMCHQLNAESEECCLKLLSLCTGRLIVPISLPVMQFISIITEVDRLLTIVAHRQHHMTVLPPTCVMNLRTRQPETLVLFIFLGYLLPLTGGWFVCCQIYTNTTGLISAKLSMRMGNRGK